MKNKLVLLLGFVFLLSHDCVRAGRVPQDSKYRWVSRSLTFTPILPASPVSTSSVAAARFVYNFSPLFGIKADFMGYTQGSGLKFTQNGQFLGNVSGNLFTYMFGPQIKKHSGKFQPFGEALFGAAHTNLDANICKLEGGCGSGSGSNNGFAMEYGLGLDIPITKTIQFRPVEVDYLYTHFGSNHIAGASASQNNFKYVAGVNFTFGGK